MALGVTSSQREPSRAILLQERRRWWVSGWNKGKPAEDAQESRKSHHTAKQWSVMSKRSFIHQILKMLLCYVVSRISRVPCNQDKFISRSFQSKKMWHCREIKNMPVFPWDHKNALSLYYGLVTMLAPQNTQCIKGDHQVHRSSRVKAIHTITKVHPLILELMVQNWYAHGKS